MSDSSSATLTDARPEAEPITLTSDQAAEVLGVTGGRRTIYYLVRERGLPHVAIGERKMGFTRAGLERWAAENERTTR